MIEFIIIIFLFYFSYKAVYSIMNLDNQLEKMLGLLADVKQLLENKNGQ